jgi:hypothetical protein
VEESTDALGAMVVAVLDNQAAGLGIPQHPSPSVGWRRMRDYCGRAKSATPRANCAGKDMNLQNGGSA